MSKKIIIATFSILAAICVSAQIFAVNNSDAGVNLQQSTKNAFRA